MKTVIARATEIARSHQHATVRPEHVVAAIAADPEHWRKCLAPISRHVLAKRAAEEVGALPTSSSYRGAAIGPPLAPETEALFVPSKWLRRPLGVALLVKRLAAHTTLFAEAVGDLKPLRDDLHAATELAAARAQTEVRVEHVLWVLTDRAWFQDALRVVGGEPRVFVRVLDERLETFARGDLDWMRLSIDLRERVARCERTHRAATSDLFVHDALLDEAIAKLFERARIAVDALERLLSEGEDPA